MTDIFTTRVQENCNGIHAQIDIETLGVSETAPIISIGAVLFDPQATDTFEALYGRAFLRLIDIEDAINVCGPVEGSTLKWWFTQSDVAIKRLVSGEVVSLKSALADLWIYTHVRGDRNPAVATLPLPTNVWAKSPSFDLKIINNACAKLKTKNPFFFSTERCVRTAIDLAFPDGDVPEFSSGVAHDARDDAVNQALAIQACYRALGLGREGVQFQRTHAVGRTA